MHRIFKILRLFFAILLAAAVIGIGAREAYTRGKNTGYKDGYSTGTANGPLTDVSHAPETDKAFTRDNFIKKINQTRNAIGLSSLPTETLLDASAQTDIDASCGKIKDANFKLDDNPDRFKGYNFYGEIVSEDTQVPTDVISEWVHNTGHQPILLRPDFTAMGIGIKDYCVAVTFGSK